MLINTFMIVMQINSKDSHVIVDDISDEGTAKKLLQLIQEDIEKDIRKFKKARRSVTVEKTERSNTIIITEYNNFTFLKIHIIKKDQVENTKAIQIMHEVFPTLFKKEEASKEE